MHPLSRSGLGDLPARVRSTAELPFEDAMTLPRGACVAPDFAALDVERLFLADRIRVGRMDEIPEPGDYIAHRIIDTSVVVVRPKDTSHWAMVDICRHRGAELPDGQGHAERIVYPFHAWIHDLHVTFDDEDAPISSRPTSLQTPITA